MNCQGCGGAWFAESRQVIAPREPGSVWHQASASRVRYVYTCASCGLLLGEAPKPKRRKRAA